MAAFALVPLDQPGRQGGTEGARPLRLPWAQLTFGVDLVIPNNAPTLPASLHGIDNTSGKPIEIRLAARVALGDPTRFALSGKVVFDPSGS